MFAIALLIGLQGMVGPVWQLHDDAYYSMLAAGHGLLDGPIEAIPYMHVWSGHAMAWLRAAGAKDPYATLVSMLAYIAIGTIAYRAWQSVASWWLGISVLALVAPFVLSLQYTAVAGLLGAASIVNLMRFDGSLPSGRAWILSGGCLVLGMLLRVEQVVLVGVCLMPIFLLLMKGSGVPLFKILAPAVATLLGVVLVFLALDHFAPVSRLNEFYKLNDPMAKVMNYGYIEAAELLSQDREFVFSKAELSVLRAWFFADLDLVEPSRMHSLVESTSTIALMKVRYWIFLGALQSLPSSYFFWFFLVGAALLLPRRQRIPVVVGAVSVLVMFLALSMSHKPPPDRVAMGPMVGFALISAISFVAERRRAGALDLRIIVFTLLLTLPLAMLVGSNRRSSPEVAHAWIPPDLPVPAGIPVYAFPGQLPLKQMHRPFNDWGVFPQTRFLGSMYLLPEVLDAEAHLPCGGFLRCLLAGERVVLIGSDEKLEALSHYLDERYSRRLEWTKHSSISTGGPYLVQLK